MSLTRQVMGQFEKSGHTVKEVIVEDLNAPISFRPFDLVFVGSTVESFFGGRISREIGNFLTGSTGLEGKKTVAYIKPNLFGTDKAMRRLMAQMEARGAFVVDFDSIKSLHEAKPLIERHINKRG